MKNPVIDKICLDYFTFDVTHERKELRLDWSNDRHHSITIKPPYERDQVKEAFLFAAALISKDTNLTA
jgi:hypothetical protein